MPTYALIDEALTVAKMQVFDSVPSLPAHKKRSDGGLLLRPVVDGGAPSIFEPFQILRKSFVVERDRVRVDYEVAEKEISEKIGAIKLEAQRRIYERFPQWKQANMTARAVELLRIGEANWSETDKSEAAALDAAWAWIQSVREASGAIESISPLPTDFASDKRWPA